MSNHRPVATIAFRRLTEDDLPQMQRWLNNPLVKRWYDDPSDTLDMVRALHLPRILGAQPIQAYFFFIDGSPAGYIQSYRPANDPDYWGDQDLSAGAVGIDLFIGEDAFRHRSFGPLVIEAYIDQFLAPDPTVTEIIIDPDPANHAAIRAYEKAGFVALREIGPPNHPEPALLMTRPARLSRM